MISVEHLTKCYGDFMAVKDLSFEIEDGHDDRVSVGNSGTREN